MTLLRNLVQPKSRTNMHNHGPIIFRCFAYCILLASTSCVVNVEIEPYEKSTEENSIQPSCSYSPEEFQDGLLGFCQTIPSANTDLKRLWYIDLQNSEVFQFEWPSTILVDDTPLDCRSLCRAGAWEIAFTGEQLQPGQLPNRLQPEPFRSIWYQPKSQARSCSILPNAQSEYPTCSGQAFSCAGQCGIGCSGCSLVMGEPCSNDPNCRNHSFQCYTRPCCVDHHACLMSATTFEGRIQCHVQAEQQGCGIQDLRGQSYEEDDAQCSPIQSACIRENEVTPSG